MYMGSPKKIGVVNDQYGSIIAKRFYNYCSQFGKSNTEW